MDHFHLIIVTGMSGAGKSHAVQVLEDIGYFCIDNIPPVLIPKFAELCIKGGERVRHVALIADIRGGEFFDAMSQCLKDLKAEGISYEIVFIEASDQALVRRYKETRRVHPLAPHGRISQGIAEERKRLASLRQKADFIIDTSNLKPKQLKEILVKRYAITDSKKSMTVTVVSFGFKYGIPIDADLVFDVRFLPNPFYVEKLRPMSGMDAEVQEYVLRSDVAKNFLSKLTDMVDFLLPQYAAEGRYALTIGIGCTGGQHRSVAVAKVLTDYLAARDANVRLRNRDFPKT